MLRTETATHRIALGATIRRWLSWGLLAGLVSVADAAPRRLTTIEAADRALQRAPRAKRIVFLECLDTESDDDTTPLDRCVGELE